MAVRNSLLQTKEALKKRIDKASEFYEDKIPAEMGNHAGVVAVPNSQNVIYCRLSNGQVVKAFNNVAPNIYNWKVYLGREKSQPAVLKVIEVRWVYNISQTVAYVLFHHGQHEYPAPDTIWVARDQFMPLLVLPNGGFHVRLYGDVIYTKGMPAPVKVESVSDLDLSSHIVSEGAKYVLMEADETGALNYVTGSTYGSIEILRLSTTPIPAPTDGSFPICAIEFYEGQTEIRRDATERNIVDLRMFTSNAEYDAGQQWHNQTEATTLDNADEFGIWNTVNSLLKRITWSNLKLAIKGYTDTLYDVLGSAAAVTANLNAHISDTLDAHDASAISVLDTGGYFAGVNVEDALQELGAGGGGGGSGVPLIIDDLTSQIPAVGDHFDLSNEAPDGIILFYNGVYQPATFYTMDGDDLGVTLDFSPISGDTLVAIYGTIGIGIPPGGAAGEVLAKSSSTDYDVEWAVGGSGGGPTLNVFNYQNFK